MRLHNTCIKLLPVFVLAFMLIGLHPAAWLRISNSVEDYSVRPANKTPSPRADHAGAYDSRKDAFYIFGGADGGTFNNELWRFKRNRWREVTPKTRTMPEPRSRHCMVYLKSDKSLYVFGGMNQERTLGDFWQYKNRRWKKLPNGPTPREGAAMAVIPEFESVYVFGGRNGNEYYNDLWRWDGEAWALWDGETWRLDFLEVDITSLPGPAPRAYHFMIDYGAELITSGGENAKGKVLVDFYNFYLHDKDTAGGWNIPANSTTIHRPNSDKLMNVRLIKSPVAGMYRFGGYDGKRSTGRTIFLDISSAKINGKYQRTLGWDWRPDLIGKPGPGKRAGHVFIWTGWDSDEKRALLFGGWRKGEVMNDTWLFHDEGWRWERIN